VSNGLTNYLTNQLTDSIE